MMKAALIKMLKYRKTNVKLQSAESIGHLKRKQIITLELKIPVHKLSTRIEMKEKTVSELEGSINSICSI